MEIIIFDMMFWIFSDVCGGIGNCMRCFVRL